ncbi:MAG: hypothetical protein Q4G43_08345 [Mobilicoccus sp.]|nr:hypothetical protein [Mobilicoccus sp.]
MVDVGAGTGHYTAHVLDALPGRVGIALDLSAHAARRAARAHPALASLVVDVRNPLPVRAGVAAVVLDVFAPRNPAEFARVLAPGGWVVVVTPRPQHLSELVSGLGLPSVDERKEERLAEQFAEFTPGPRRGISEVLSVDPAIAASLARMGPGAHHVERSAVEELAACSQDVAVTVAVDVRTYLR